MTKRKLHETILADFYLYQIESCKSDCQPIEFEMLERQFKFFKDMLKDE